MDALHLQSRHDDLILDKTKYERELRQAIDNIKSHVGEAAFSPQMLRQLLVTLFDLFKGYAGTVSRSTRLLDDFRNQYLEIMKRFQNLSNLSGSDGTYYFNTISGTFEKVQQTNAATNARAALVNAAMSTNARAGLVNAATNANVRAASVNAATSTNARAALVNAATNANVSRENAATSTNARAALVNAATNANARAGLVNAATNANSRAALVNAATNANVRAGLVNAATNANVSRENAATSTNARAALVNAATNANVSRENAATSTNVFRENAATNANARATLVNAATKTANVSRENAANNAHAASVNSPTVSRENAANNARAANKPQLLEPDDDSNAEEVQAQKLDDLSAPKELDEYVPPSKISKHARSYMLSDSIRNMINQMPSVFNQLFMVSQPAVQHGGAGNDPPVSEQSLVRKALMQITMAYEALLRVPVLIRMFGLPMGVVRQVPGLRLTDLQVIMNIVFESLPGVAMDMLLKKAKAHAINFDLAQAVKESSDNVRVILGSAREQYLFRPLLHVLLLNLAANIDLSTDPEFAEFIIRYITKHANDFATSAQNVANFQDNYKSAFKTVHNNYDRVLTYIRVQHMNTPVNRRFDLFVNEGQPQNLWVHYTPTKLRMVDGVPLSQAAIDNEKQQWPIRALGEAYSAKSTHPLQYMYGPFTRVFGPGDDNGRMARQCQQLLDKLSTPKQAVLAVGYGASGAGKTSTLVYLWNRATGQRQAGVIIEVLKLLQATKNLTSITAEAQEYGQTLDDVDTSAVIKIHPQVTFRWTNDEFYVDNSVPIGQWMLDVVDGQRRVSPTPNNPQSSRSHVIMRLHLTDLDSTLYVADFAGVENRFQCTDVETLIKFSQSQTPACSDVSKKQSYTEASYAELKQSGGAEGNNAIPRLQETVYSEKSENLNAYVAFLKNVNASSSKSVKWPSLSDPTKKVARPQMQPTSSFDAVRAQLLYDDAVAFAKFFGAWDEENKREALPYRFDEYITSKSVEKYHSDVVAYYKLMFTYCKLQKIGGLAQQLNECIQSIKKSPHCPARGFTLFGVTFDPRVDKLEDHIGPVKRAAGSCVAPEFVGKWLAMRLKRYKNMLEAYNICVCRNAEGAFINLSLARMRSFLTRVISSMAQVGPVRSPKFDDVCVKMQCHPWTESCFGLPDGAVDKLAFKKQDPMFARLSSEPSLSLAVFGVFNWSERANNPPTVPYIDVTGLQQIIVSMTSKSVPMTDTKVPGHPETDRNAVLQQLAAWLEFYKAEIDAQVRASALSLISAVSEDRTAQPLAKLVELHKLLDVHNAASALGTLQLLDSLAKLSTSSPVCGWNETLKLNSMIVDRYAYKRMA